MAVALRDIIGFLDARLEAPEWPDLGPNGLQVPGPAHVDTVATGVSGQLELFERAAKAGAQLVLVHHGILWDFAPRRIDARHAARLEALLGHGLALAAYHLPLDAHPELGNNALLADGLGAERGGREPFAEFKGRRVGWSARFGGDGLPLDELCARVEALCGQAPLVQGAGPERVRSIGICSGGGADALQEAIDLGLDALLTGEPREHVMADAREARIHFLAAGHYATETFGVRALGDLLAEEFGVRHEWLDIPNPV